MLAGDVRSSPTGIGDTVPQVICGQATVLERVSLWPIFEVCVRDTGYEGGGRLQVTWWMQEAAENQMKVKIEEILSAARVRRRQESGRWDRSKGG